MIEQENKDREIDFDKIAQGNEKFLKIYKENLALKQKNEELAHQLKHKNLPLEDKLKSVEEERDHLLNEQCRLECELKESQRNNRNKLAKVHAGWSSSLVGVFICAAAVFFCVGSCCNGCAADELHAINGCYDNGTGAMIVKEIYPMNNRLYDDEAQYRISDRVILYDKKGKYNIGDTIVCGKLVNNKIVNY